MEIYTANNMSKWKAFEHGGNLYASLAFVNGFIKMITTNSFDKVVVIQALE